MFGRIAARNITLCQAAELAWTNPDTGALFVNRAAGAQGPHHCCQGIESK